ncbi:MAG: O-antigen ligase family protein [Candidatus Omnitrophica bacterium]|nr:O-antigen ligase family protein [Candidatus Omnitrophota bacterium]
MMRILEKIRLSAQSLQRVLTYLLVVYLVTFFLTLGADYPGHLFFREIYGAILFVLLIGVFWRDFRSNRKYHLSVIYFGLFVSYEVFRMAYAAFALGTGVHETLHLPLSRFMEVPFRWGFYFIYFFVCTFCFKKKSDVKMLMNWMGWMSAFLAVNAIPALLMRPGEIPSGYLSEGRFLSFFYPTFYVFDWIPQYILSIHSQPNFIGDIVGFGFFPALGLIFYKIFEIKDISKRAKDHPGEKMDSKEILYLGWRMFFAFLIAAAVILLLSRGSIVAFSGSLIFYLLLLGIKFRHKGGLVFVLLITMIMGLFLSMSVNWGQVKREFKALKIEQEGWKNDPNHDVRLSRSIYTNRAGAQRAWAIYKAHPLWGVGTNGYRSLSETYSRGGAWDSFPVAKFQAMNHYLQLLAEEGVGAFLYFLFLFVYFFEMIRGMMRVKSRFQFLAALSLMAPVLMVFSHASINDLMQRFSTSMLVYATMGASLGVLREDYDHH